ncbi:hypothetical protein ANN_18795 [Periplaneta americana]|uniref:Uncharacterized protein n=1 Tax=Periplaneta americana TaxID=6978 RepID=A0ABQ8SPS7_PERAM|nr:hypothetical protein ANN_18795 [Periplaneta americana]
MRRRQTDDSTCAKISFNIETSFVTGKREHISGTKSAQAVKRWFRSEAADFYDTTINAMFSQHYQLRFRKTVGYCAESAVSSVFVGPTHWEKKQNTSKEKVVGRVPERDWSAVDENSEGQAEKVFLSRLTTLEELKQSISDVIENILRNVLTNAVYTRSIEERLFLTEQHVRVVLDRSDIMSRPQYEVRIFENNSRRVTTPDAILRVREFSHISKY